MVLQEQQLDDDHLQLECCNTRTGFEEYEKFKAHLESICEIHSVSSSSNGTNTKTCKEKLKSSSIKLEKYQEQPQLLDSHLEDISGTIIGTLKASLKLPDFRFHQLCRLLYIISKVRGTKTIVKFFSHEAADLEPLLECLESVDKRDFQLWTTRFCLLTWLSLVIRIPFDLSRIDSRNQLVSSIENMCMEYLSASGKERDAAAELLSRLYTRKDTANLFSSFVSTCVDTSLTSENTFKVIGMLQLLCGVYKHGQREPLQPHGGTLLKFVQKLVHEPEMYRNSVIRKFCIKLVQRIGLSFLKPKLAPWRYQRGLRILGSIKKTTVETTTFSHGIVNDDSDDYDEIPDCLEEIIDYLLQGVSDKETIVRWSAAKGIGRLTQRLPKELGQDVVESIVSLFSENTFLSDNEVDFSAVNDSTWHGACLSLAELARHGLLLPDKLPSVITWVIKALNYEKRRVSHSIGANVRDSACYVCWAFARAYSPEIMKPYVFELAPHLITVAVYDREVNVRRAASAAFQESVGRQGIFPHGIDIVTTADYYSVGNRTNAFLDTSIKIAAYEEYRSYFIDHLASSKCIHWDPEVRKIASEAFGKISLIENKYIFEKWIEYFISKATDYDLVSRHGALMTLSSLLNVLTDLELIQKDTRDSMVYLPLKIQSDFSPYLSGSGSDQYATALCCYISRISRFQNQIPPEISRVYLKIIENCIVHLELIVQETAAVALTTFINLHGVEAERLLEYARQLEPTKDPIVRRGFAVAFQFLSFHTTEVFTNNVEFKKLLIDATKVIDDCQARNDPDARRFACFTLAKICVHLQAKDMISEIIQVLLDSLEDYSTDARGDVGSWVRESSLKSLCEIIMYFYQERKNELLDKNLISIAVSKFLRLALERIDKIRSVAGDCLKKVLSISSLDIPHKNVLDSIIFSDQVDFTLASTVFPKFVELAAFEPFRHQVMLGVSYTIGSLTESLAVPASKALIDFLSALPSSNCTVRDIVETIVDIFEKNTKIDRIITPVLESLDQVLSLQLFDEIDPVLVERLLRLIRGELFKSRDVKKLVAGTKVISSMSLHPDKIVRQKSQTYMLNYLVHPLPRIRKSAAENLYLAFISSIERLDKQDEIETILTETNWDHAIALCRTERDKLYQFLNIEKP